MTTYLLDLSGRNDLKRISQQPDIILFVSCLLERLRGVATAAEPRIQKAIYEMGFSMMNPILIFLDVYKNEVISFRFLECSFDTTRAVKQQQIALLVHFDVGGHDFST